MDRRSTPTYLSRRQFVRLLASASLGTALASCGHDEPATHVVAPPSATHGAAAPSATQGAAAPSATQGMAPPSATQGAAAPSATQGVVAPSATRAAAYLGVAHGGDPGAITRAAVAAVGGIERFVKAGDDVIVKPNICVDYRPYEYGATTNPHVVAALVEMCLSAGARRVRVMDTPFGGNPESAYAQSGIAAAVAAVGGAMEVMNPAKFRDTDIPAGLDIIQWPIYQDILTADVVINVPIAKHHSLARLTLGGKNLLGVVQKPSHLHANLGQRIADLVSLVRPSLTVIDAVRTLMAHGPTGGNLDDVRLTNMVIASPDIVAADAYAATLFGLKGDDISYVKAAAAMGLGTIDLAGVEVEEISL